VRAVLAIAQTLAASTICFSSPAGTETEPHTEVIPEWDAFWTLNSHARLLFLAAVTNDRTVKHRDVDFGAFIDFFVPRFHPVLFRRISLADDSRVRRITIRAGYKHIQSASDKPPKTEHRLETDLTLRWALRGDFLLSSRSRGELRFVSGDFSSRFREQLKLERDLKIGRRPVTPFVSAELYYDSVYATVSRWRYHAGADIAFGRRWVVEPYYERKVVKHSALELTNGIGLTISFHGP
jgi:hypothetical protein